ncbi:GntR family transcriptional regulator [Nocardiopsis sp. NPDC006198]|jgi:DNA-binding GntR family transcriptional regulator|uniref:GntR family transcriptional regulator n=2 Tax=Nocardiopsidaceae TaxID=83676 RepID=A0ABY6YJ23_9ACTN|nr:GntR family transcriptional regulator [Streptomonospora nanhaiensis]WAE72308.1 GntR family transcriptional regulator [Streptomonospora nanhaiensis]
MSIDARRARTTPVLGSLAEPTSLRSRVTQVLREAMVAGELAPDTIYSAPALAERLGVSATPVREAMMELTREGLVETIRHRGYRVVELGDVALDEIIELRALIEVPTVGRVAGTATAEQVARLRPLADRLTETAESGELREFVAADTAFHLQLLAIAGNARIVEEVRRLRGMSRLSALRRLHQEGRLTATAREHHALLDRVEARDAPGAEALMRHHLGHVRGVWAGLPES